MLQYLSSKCKWYPASLLILVSGLCGCPAPSAELRPPTLSPEQLSKFNVTQDQINQWNASNVAETSSGQAAADLSQLAVVNCGQNVPTPVLSVSDCGQNPLPQLSVSGCTQNPLPEISVSTCGQFPTLAP